MELSVRPSANREMREAVLHRWYRRQVRGLLLVLIAKWEPEVGTRVAEVRIRKMQTRWGTCNRDTLRIWLNLELVKKPVSCLEYIMVHEMVHLIERHHNDRFKDLMDKLMLPRPTISLDSDLRNYNAGGSRYVQRNAGGIRNREGSP